MRRILCGLIIGFCLFPNIINALECSASDKQRLQKLASNISYILEEYEENGKTYFRATFTGLSKELRVHNEKTLISHYNFVDAEFGETIVRKMNLGETYTFAIYGNDTCVFNMLRKITISIPIYNKYYNDPICDNVREYKICQKWFNNNGVSYDEFKNNVNNYIKLQENNDNDNDDDTSNDYDIFDFDFGKFYRQVYFPSLIMTIFLIGLLILFWNKENKKNRL